MENQMADYENTIPTLWIQHLSGDEKKKFLEVLQNHSTDLVLLRLKEIVKSKAKALEASERNPEAYGNAAWPYKQAHNNGARQTLKMVEDLLSFTKG